MSFSGVINAYVVEVVAGSGGFSLAGRAYPAAVP
jgi:hypothetical protein